MYLTHFGLDRPLFDDGIARDGAVFVSRADRDALAHTAMAMTSRDSIVVLHGPPGIGKTTFAATAVGATSESSRVATAWLGTPALSPYEMLELLLLEFGFDPYKQTRVERLQTWRQFLIEMMATDTRIFIAVEHADDLDPGVLKALAALTAADPNGCPGANVVLMGQDRLADMLNAPDLAELKQRVRLRRRFVPYDEATLQQYLEHRVRAAGGDFDSVFGAGAVAALRAHTGGILRVINHVAETALGLTASRGARRVTAGAIRIAAVEVCGCAGPSPSGSIENSDSLAAGRESEPDVEVVPPAPDEIPVLTEQVDIDLDAPETAPPPQTVAAPSDAARAASAQAVAAQAQTGSTSGGAEAIAAGTAKPVDAQLDQLSAELVDAILSDSDDGCTADLDTAHAGAPGRADPSSPSRDGSVPGGAAGNRARLRLRASA